MLLLLHHRPSEGRGHGRSPRHCLSPTALVRVQARDSCSAGGRATRASTSVWLVDRCQPVWTVTAGIEGMTWRSAGHRAACWLLSRVALSGCHHHPGNPVQKLSASECYLAALPPSFPLSCCMRGRNARGSAAARRGSCFAPSSEQTGSRTRGRSSSHTYCSCHPQPVVYPHPSQPLFSHIEAV